MRLTADEITQAFARRLRLDANHREARQAACVARGATITEAGMSAQGRAFLNAHNGAEGSIGAEMARGRRAAEIARFLPFHDHHRGAK